MPAAEENPEQQRRFFAELWTSFVALIRSYVAAHDLAKPASEHTRMEAADAGRLTVRSADKALGLEFDAAQGAGSWMIYEDGLDRVLERGTFEMDEDSQVALSDRAGKLELEVAAEAFTAKVFSEE